MPENEPAQPEGVADDERRLRAQKLITEFRRRVMASDKVSEQSLLAAHPDLAAELTEGLRRLRLIDEASSAFIYYISRLGVSGVRDDLPEGLAEEISRVRSQVKKPIVIGFGISTPDQAAAVAPLADGIVVGSALVRLISDHPPEEAAKEIQLLAGELAHAIRRDSGEES